MGIPFRAIAEAIGSRLGLPATSVPLDELTVPGYFGFLANIVTQSYPASNLISRRILGWEPAWPACSPIWTRATTSRRLSRERQGPESLFALCPRVRMFQEQLTHQLPVPCVAR